MGGVLWKTLSAFRANEQGETAEPGTPCFPFSIGHFVPKSTACRLAERAFLKSGWGAKEQIEGMIGMGIVVALGLRGIGVVISQQ